MFAGEFRCKLDDKGRFFIPSSIRELLDKGKPDQTKSVMFVRGQTGVFVAVLPTRLGTKISTRQRNPG